MSKDAPPTGNQSDDETEAPGKQNQPETVCGKHQLGVDQLTRGGGASEMYRSRPPRVSSFSLQRMTCQMQSETDYGCRLVIRFDDVLFF